MGANARRADVGDLAIRLIETAAPAASALPAMVLIHGIGMSHRYLARLHAALAEETDVVSIDLPGFGGLPQPAADVGVERMAAAIDDAVAALGFDRVVLIGHSMGAQWAVAAAIRGAAAVEMVVAIGPVADDRHRTPWAQAGALALDSLGEPPAVNAIVWRDWLRCGIPWYLTQLRHMLSYPLEDAVRRLTVPLLVIRGADDPVAGREWCRRLRDGAPIARLIEVPGRRHIVQETAPEAVASAVLRHCAKPWPRAGRDEATGGAA